MKYASVYPRGASPFWWISYRDPATGERKHSSSKIRRDDPSGKRRAYDLALQHSKAAQAAGPSTSSEAWESWVPGFLRLTFSDKPKTFQRYETAWSHLQEFFQEKGLPAPRSLIYRHAEDYLIWRTSQKRRRGTTINYNTALTELRVLSRLMREAVRRGFVGANPIAQLGFGRKNVKEKPEISTDEDAQIRNELNIRPNWMRDCYEVAMAQGCRLSETAVPMRKIDLARRQITFRGKKEKIFTTALSEKLIPLIKRREKEGAKVLVDLPQMPAKAWHTFFNKIDLGHLSFHCTRVTVITRLARAGVSQQMAMRFVGHASETVHRVYQRLTAPDLGPALAALR